MVQKHTGFQGDMSIMNRMIDEFARDIMGRAARDRVSAGKSWKIKTPEDLLNLRRELVELVYQGMKRKQNLEGEIALLACIIYWERKAYDAALEQREYEAGVGTLAPRTEEELQSIADERRAWDRVKSPG